MPRSTIVLKKINKSLIYNYKLLIIVIVLKDTYLKQTIKKIYSIDEHI